jgi:carbon starvation protein CstA
MAVAPRLLLLVLGPLSQRGQGISRGSRTTSEKGRGAGVVILILILILIVIIGSGQSP